MSNASYIAEEIVSKNLSARSVELIVRRQKALKRQVKIVDANILNEQNNIQDNLGLKVVINNKK